MAKVEVLGAKRLSECEWFAGAYVDVYRILALEGRLPPPDEIYVATELAGELQGVEALADPARMVVWFSETPPSLETFAHELIHLCKKRGELHEETYANLSLLVAMLARGGVTPRKHPLSLFEDVTAEDLLRAIAEVYRFPFESLGEFFRFQGVIPIFLVMEMDERHTVVAAICELIAGAAWDPRMFSVLLKLLGL